MSQRNALSNKAIKEAWIHEQALVAQGKGTRDWTTQQQADILTKGKAFDENGRAFQGHHMKNVKDHPEHQGKWENIQFLSRDEHIKAHNNNFRNKTNGMYDHKTGKTQVFGNKSYSRPSEINLSSRIPAKYLDAYKSKVNSEKIANKSATAAKFNAPSASHGHSHGAAKSAGRGHGR